MKYIFIILFSAFCHFTTICQNQDTTIKQQPSGKSFLRFGMPLSTPPLYFIDGIAFTGDLSSIKPDTIGAIFVEGDSSYIRRTYGDSPDTSLIRKYFGKERDKGILFLFTKNNVLRITQQQFEKYLKKEKGKMLFKIDNEPLTDIYHKACIDKIQIVKDFTLTHWNTGIIDAFTLFIIKSK